MAKTKTEIKTAILNCLEYKTITEAGVYCHYSPDMLGLHFGRHPMTIRASRAPHVQNRYMYDKLYVQETAHAKIAALLEEL